MNLLEALKEIKAKLNDKDISVRSLLAARRCDDNIMKVCISVKDNLISLAGLPLSLDDMLADDWDLLVHYKMGNSYEELEK